ncbi:SUMO-activating enzyme subunit 2 [Portunus trituberculatus]|uniref:SUMO-activating enzyme subunit 2 n=1 Tax=Portunus trituberculatus TaxID=210409 RepID=A0A5B7HYK8_PORTR|nr:SUMO-activating enzyme subunit 2 [Portunus trituberculatus]
MKLQTFLILIVYLQTYLNRRPNPRRRLLVPCALDPPRPQCLVCAPRPRLALKLSVAHTSVGALKDKVLRGALAMAAPDVEVVDGKGTILISSEEGETQENNEKMLKSSLLQQNGIHERLEGR